MTSTRISWGRTASSAPGASLRSAIRSGTVTVKVEPAPFSLSTVMLPFIISTIFFVIAIPSPVLPHLFALFASSWENASKIFGINSLSMPTPVSRMTKRRGAFPSNCASGSTIKETVPPSGVNFTALPRMLMRTCLSFMLSPM